MAELPMIISVDDHIVEPADTWTSRMPAKFKDAAPHIVRKDMPAVTYVGGKLTVNEGGGGAPADWWIYESLQRPLKTIDGSADALR